MQEYPEDLIILADDDLFYPLDMIEKLLILHKDNPEDIVCMTPQIISPGFDSYPSEWRHPKLDEKISKIDELAEVTKKQNEDILSQDELKYGKSMKEKYTGEACKNACW